MDFMLEVKENSRRQNHDKDWADEDLWKWVDKYIEKHPPSKKCQEMLDDIRRVSEEEISKPVQIETVTKSNREFNKPTF